jgi:tetratricopeptide (TPR) repeat protein
MKKFFQKNIKFLFYKIKFHNYNTNIEIGEKKTAIESEEVKTAFLLYTEKKYEESKKILEEELEREKDDILKANILNNLGLIFSENEKDHNKAQEYFGNSLKLSPSSKTFANYGYLFLYFLFLSKIGKK